MADYFIGLDRGQAGSSDEDFTVGTSTGATDIELRYTTSGSITKKDVDLALKAFQRYLTNKMNSATLPG